jgi:uncharacterized protein YbjT (DUF2867 family)
VILKMGVYPQPIGGAGLSRVDLRDIAEAAAITLTTSGHEGQSFDLVGPDVLTGASCAETWSRVLGRPVVYGGDDLDAWEKQSLQYLPDWAACDFRNMYEFFQEQGLKASAEAIDRQTRLLGPCPAIVRRLRGRNRRGLDEMNRCALIAVRWSLKAS